MPFNCPGHQSHHKGLSGCGVDTVNAPVDTSFTVNFTVLDLGTPPATSTVQRHVIVVSPCEPSEIYCADLAVPATRTGEHACGTTDCVSRAAIIALQPPDTSDVAPSLEFSSAVPLAAVSSLQQQGTFTAGLGHMPISEVCPRKRFSGALQ